MKSKIFIVDDNAFLRTCLRNLLNAQVDLHVCGEADSVESALVQIPNSGADMGIVDLDLGNTETDGIELIRTMQFQNNQLPVLVLSSHEEVIFAPKALAAGARGYLMKQDSRKNLLDAVHMVLQGKIYLSDHLVKENHHVKHD